MLAQWNCRCLRRKPVGRVLVSRYVTGSATTFPPVARGRIGKGCNVTAADGVGVDTDPCPEMLMRPVGQFTASALIAKIGENGRPMGIGNATTLMAPADGVLYFRINDPMTWDNEGQITVRVALDTRQVIPAEAGQNREDGGGQGGGAGGRRNLR